MDLLSVKPEVNNDPESDDDLEPGGANGASQGFRPRPPLIEPAVYTRTLAYLIRGLEQEEIDVNPEYQRDIVWTADRMTGLINSLIENFYIPPIILNRKTEVGKLVCVDGKQRLSSIQAFVQGRIPCHDEFGAKWWFSIAEKSKGRKIIPEETQREFLNKELVSFEYTDLSIEQEEDLFGRVQMGMSLTAAEKMRAQSGPWQELTRLFVDDFPAVCSLLKERTRAKDFQLVLASFSQIIECEEAEKRGVKPVLRTSLAELEKLLAKQDILDDRLKAHFANVFNTYQELVNEDKETFVNSTRKFNNVQTFAPIEMVGVAVLISKYSESRNNSLLLKDIEGMRCKLREEFAELRGQVKVWAFLWGYIENIPTERGTATGAAIDRSSRSDTSVTQPQPWAQALVTLKRGNQNSASHEQNQVVRPNATNTLRKRETDGATSVRKRQRQTERDTNAAPIEYTSEVIGELEERTREIRAKREARRGGGRVDDSPSTEPHSSTPNIKEEAVDTRPSRTRQPPVLVSRKASSTVSRESKEEEPRNTPTRPTQRTPIPLPWRPSRGDHGLTDNIPGPPKTMPRQTKSTIPPPPPSNPTRVLSPVDNVPSTRANAFTRRPRKTPIPLPTQDAKPHRPSQWNPTPTPPPNSKPVSNPYEARQNRVEQLNSYVTLLPPYPYRVPTAPMDSPHRTASPPPRPIRDELQIQQHIASSLMDDEVVDLTSDAENEVQRQNLLTSFRRPHS